MRGLAACLAVCLCGWSTTGHGAASAAPVVSAVPAPIMAMRRLTEAQYRNIIADIFGTDIKVGGRFDPIVRPDQGLLAAGSSESTISPSGLEQFDAMAKAIAGQVLVADRRNAFVPCKPQDKARLDTACAQAFYWRYGPLVLRRPMTASELDFYVGIANRAAATTGDFHTGLGVGLSSLLVSPEFLYRVETAAADGHELSAWSKASRLSFLLWNTMPDEALLNAAARGQLETPRGLQAQVDRMLASPRLEQGVRAFFTDVFYLDRVSDLAKDPIVYPRFVASVPQELAEQLLRTLLDHLIVADRPYPELFTSRKTFLTRRLGVVYRVPVSQVEGWQPHEFDADDERAGLLGQGAFLALYSHEGRSSPTLRGKAIREVLLCQPVPMPPANVDFSGFNDTGNVVLRTARQRLGRHSSDPVCAGCHKITDPLGLPLERFDGIGAFRLEENGAPIDATGTFEDKPFKGADNLGRLLAQSRAPGECLTHRMAEYATGLGTDEVSAKWTQALAKDFEAGGSRLRDLLRRIALSPEFYAVPTRATTSAEMAKLEAKAPSKQEAR